ncbi:MAG: pseudouridine synthase [Lachnospira sp.]|jgi:23S rRNA pseudouridine2604 synthase|uniref:pseudouridine synthase n=1 Tax=Lachnospira sp. TaxID=2049031 RepID=UPI000E81CEC3|nr:pseudouridine synthase [Eubacterium sp.]HBS90585.1 23S rRNA pseudouridine synthase F [Eubacterium sp.]
MRINKYLSAQGVCSRREADRLLEAGRITVDGVTAMCGQQVDDNSVICIDGSRISDEKPQDVLMAFNKPRGIVCTTTDNQGKNNIVDYIGYDKRIYPVGRLDKDSDGLILLTNNGEITDKILRSVNGHEKEYVVKVNKKITDTFLKNMADGVYLKELDVTTKPCSISRINNYTFRIILTQGLNRQIRRMCQESGYKVESLTRVRIMNIELGGLKIGEYRIIEGKEKTMLYESL